MNAKITPHSQLNDKAVETIHMQGGNMERALEKGRDFLHWSGFGKWSFSRASTAFHLPSLLPLPCPAMTSISIKAWQQMSCKYHINMAVMLGNLMPDYYSEWWPRLTQEKAIAVSNGRCKVAASLPLHLDLAGLKNADNLLLILAKYITLQLFFIFSLGEMMQCAWIIWKWFLYRGILHLNR